MRAGERVGLKKRAKDSKKMMRRGRVRGGRVEENKRAGRERCKGELVGEGVVRLGVCKGPALPAGPGPSGPLTSPVYLATSAAPHSFESPHLSSSALCHKTARVLLRG